jgi:hypothetical protein
VTLRASVIEPGVDACVRGELLAVLPIELVAHFGVGGKLRALNAIPVPETSLFMVRRRPVHTRATSSDALLAELSRPSVLARGGRPSGRSRQGVQSAR